MKPETLEELIASLSPEETEKYCGLIDECLERKRLIREHTARIFCSLEQVSTDIRTIQEGIRDIEKYGKFQADLMDTFLADMRPLLRSLIHTKPSSN